MTTIHVKGLDHDSRQRVLQPHLGRLVTVTGTRLGGRHDRFDGRLVSCYPFVRISPLIDQGEDYDVFSPETVVVHPKRSRQKPSRPVLVRLSAETVDGFTDQLLSAVWDELGSRSLTDDVDDETADNIRDALRDRIRATLEGKG